MNVNKKETYTYKNQEFALLRYPYIKEGDIRIYSAADEHILNELEDYKDKSILIFHDRYAFLSKLLSLSNNVSSVISYSSQLHAFDLNDSDKKIMRYKLSERISSKYNLIIIKLPKSFELLDYYLRIANQVSTEKTIVYINFMTRHFSEKILNIAGKYYSKQSQSRIMKKARFLKNEMFIADPVPLEEETIRYENLALKGSSGAFSGKSLDMATQFLLETIKREEIDFTGTGIDIGSGSGIMSFFLKDTFPNIKITGIEDYYLSYLKSLESARLNKLDIDFLWSDNLENVSDASIDFIISNPPFHFEYVNTIEISFSLFLEAKRVLRKNGSFLIVYNNHLNYQTFLTKHFTCTVLNKNEKFTVLICQKL
jgi:23S rRNA (guanine1835-N2)-methyltransferase